LVVEKNLFQRLGISKRAVYDFKGVGCRRVSKNDDRQGTNTARELINRDE